MLYPVRHFICSTPACGGFTEHTAEYDEEGRMYCPYCGCDDGFAPAPDEEARWVTVALFSLDRVYGGPEEGGWYYTTGMPVPGTRREFAREDLPQAKVYEQTLLNRHGWDRDMSVRVVIEAQAKPFPKTRPHYC